MILIVSGKKNPPEKSKMTENLEHFNVQHLFRQFFLKNQCVSDAQLECWINRTYIFGSTYQSIKINRLSIYLFHKGIQQKLHSPPMDKELAIMNANRIFRHYGFTIRKVFSESIDETFYYLLTNDIEDVLNAKSTWTQAENAFYHLLLDAIIQPFLENDFDIDDEDAFNVAKHLAIGMTSANNLARNTTIAIILGEKIVKNWINQHWFKQIDSGNKITLGVRTIAQKSSYLIRKYGLSACKYCSLVCFHGFFCSQCNVCWHEKCLPVNSTTLLSPLLCSSCDSPLAVNQIFNNKNNNN